MTASGGTQLRLLGPSVAEPDGAVTMQLVVEGDPDAVRQPRVRTRWQAIVVEEPLASISDWLESDASLLGAARAAGLTAYGTGAVVGDDLAHRFNVGHGHCAVVRCTARVGDAATSQVETFTHVIRVQA